MATLAHEIAHEILLRGEHLTGNEADHEQVTDLLPAFLGVGIFGANATLRTSSGWEGGMSWWSISSQGYLSSLVLGYALALFAFVRGEETPWSRHLSPDARGALQNGLRFLRKTGDSLFTPDTAGTPQPVPTAARALDWLGGSPTFRIAALWDISTVPLTDPRLHEPVVRCLSHADDSVRQEAAWSVSRFGSAATDALPQLVALLSDHHPSVRAGAARALGVLRLDAGAVVPALAHALEDRRGYVGWETAESLRAYGPAAVLALPKLMAAFERAVGSNEDVTGVLALAVHAISPNAQKAVREHIGARDPDLLRAALRELREAANDPAPIARREPPPLQLEIPRPHARR